VSTVFNLSLPILLKYFIIRDPIDQQFKNSRPNLSGNSSLLNLSYTIEMWAFSRVGTLTARKQNSFSVFFAEFLWGWDLWFVWCLKELREKTLLPIPKKEQTWAHKVLNQAQTQAQYTGAVENTSPSATLMYALIYRDPIDQTQAIVRDPISTTGI
jgi:hypothetical protein